MTPVPRGKIPDRLGRRGACRIGQDVSGLQRHRLPLEQTPREPPIQHGVHRAQRDRAGPGKRRRLRLRQPELKPESFLLRQHDHRGKRQSHARSRVGIRHCAAEGCLDNQHVLDAVQSRLALSDLQIELLKLAILEIGCSLQVLGKLLGQCIALCLCLLDCGPNLRHVGVDGVRLLARAGRESRQTRLDMSPPALHTATRGNGECRVPSRERGQGLSWPAKFTGSEVPAQTTKQEEKASPRAPTDHSVSNLMQLGGFFSLWRSSIRNSSFCTSVWRTLTSVALSSSSRWAAAS